MSICGQRGKPRFEIIREQVDFFLEQNFKWKDISCLMAASGSTVKRRICEFRINVTDRYCDFHNEQLDQLVIQFLTEFSNSGYRCMTIRRMR